MATALRQVTLSDAWLQLPLGSDPKLAGWQGKSADFLDPRSSVCLDPIRVGLRQESVQLVEYFSLWHTAPFSSSSGPPLISQIYT